MKIITSLVTLVAAFALLLGTSHAISSPDQTESTTTGDPSSQKYLVVTEDDNGKTIQLPANTLLCVRFYDTTTCSAHQNPNDPFIETTSTWSFKSASSTEFLELQKELSAISTDVTSEPSDKKTEHEWVFGGIVPGKTTLVFNKFRSSMSYNRSPVPDSMSITPISFMIETIAP